MRFKIAMLTVFLYGLSSIVIAGSFWQGASEKAMREIQLNIRDETLTEGAFRGLEIGYAKSDAIVQLKEFGVHQLQVDPEIIYVSDSKELHKLWGFDNLKAALGSIIIRFKGDSIQSIQVSPVFTDWRQKLDNAENKEQIFDVLSLFLHSAKKPYRVMQNYDPDAGWVKLDNASQEDKERLEKFNHWEASFHDDEGFWHLTLDFNDGTLSSLRIQFSPVELP